MEWIQFDPFIELFVFSSRVAIVKGHGLGIGVDPRLSPAPAEECALPESSIGSISRDALMASAV